jgi:hypothetical protein
MIRAGCDGRKLFFVMARIQGDSGDPGKGIIESADDPNEHGVEEINDWQGDPDSS